MDNLNLQKAAERLGLTRPALMKRMRAAGLIGADKLPLHPVRDRLYLVTHESSWFHPELGMQYSTTTRVRPAGIAWLAEKLGIERPMPEPTPDRCDVA